jgi:hypothetical protein
MSTRNPAGLALQWDPIPSAGVGDWGYFELYRKLHEPS